MTFEINYKENGDVLYGSDVRENIGFAITSAINFALDGATVTNQDNVDVDLFVADTASTTTNFTYSGGDDWYEADNGQDTCTLITDSHTITTSDNVVIVKGDITKEAGTIVTTSVSCDGGVNWQEVTEKELAKITNTGTSLMVKWVFDRTADNTGTDYVTGYAIYYG